MTPTPGLHQVAPVLDALRVALSDEEHDRRGVGRSCSAAAASASPALIEAALRDRVDVVGQRQRDDVGVEAVDDRPRLGAGSAVRLLHRHGLAGFLPPVLGEGRVELGVQLARGVVRHVQQLDRRRGRRIRALVFGGRAAARGECQHGQQQCAGNRTWNGCHSPQKATCARNTMASSGSRSGARPPSNVVCSKVA